MFSVEVRGSITADLELENIWCVVGFCVSGYPPILIFIFQLLNGKGNRRLHTTFILATLKTESTQQGVSIDH